MQEKKALNMPSNQDTALCCSHKKANGSLDVIRPNIVRKRQSSTCTTIPGLVKPYLKHCVQFGSLTLKKINLNSSK